MPGKLKMPIERRRAQIPVAALFYVGVAIIAFVGADIGVTVYGFGGSRGRGESIMSQLERVERKLECWSPSTAK